jgi:glycosyltransferase involved in cell wall biosynthesis
MLNLFKGEPRIRFLMRSSNRNGACACRNEGISNSTGDYVIFLDSDDCLAPFCLEKRVQIMESNANLDFAIFPCKLFQKHPNDLGLLWNIETQENDIDRFLSLDVPWQTTSPIWRQQALKQVGVWDTSLLSWQDWEFHLRALIQGLTYKIFSPPDCFWRVPDNESIGLKSLTSEHLHSHEQLFQKIHCMLSERQLLNSNRQCLIAGLYFFLAKSWRSQGDVTEAVRVWTICWNEQLVSNMRYLEGLFYLKTIGMRGVRRIGQKYLEMRWPKRLRTQYSNTFRNTPYVSAL